MVHTFDEILAELQTWEYHENNVRTGDFPEKDKIRILNCFKKMKGLLGEDFFKRIYKDGFNSHPLTEYFNNLIPQTRYWIADLIDELESVEKIALFDNVKKRIIDPKEYFGALIEVRVGALLVKKGYNFEYIPQSRKERLPDIKVLEPELFIECTSKTMPYERVESGNTIRAIMDVFYQNINLPITQGGRILKVISKSHLEQIKEKIRKAVDKVKTGGFEKIEEPGVIEYYVSHNSNRDLIPEHYRNSWHPPVIPLNEPSRIRETITRKMGQIGDKLGIIVIHDTNISGDSPFEPVDANDLVWQINEKVYNFDNLLQVVIATNEQVKVDSKQKQELDLQYETFERDYAGTKTTFIVIPNLFCKDKELSSKMVSLWGE